MAIYPFIYFICLDYIGQSSPKVEKNADTREKLYPVISNAIKIRLRIKYFT
jgi:hypothetical protein